MVLFFVKHHDINFQASEKSLSITHVPNLFGNC